MRVLLQQRLQLSTTRTGAFTLGVVITVLVAAIVVYLQMRAPRVAHEAERYLGETDR